MTSPHQRRRTVGRSEILYRKLLIAYPRDFRTEYGEDLVQSFRDLMMMSSDGRGVWWRTVRDLFSSATRERGSMLRHRGRPPVWLLLVVAMSALALIIAGPGLFLPLILLPSLVLVGLPAYGLTLFRRAWVTRRTTGGPVARPILLGILSFVPAAAALAWLGQDAGYFVFVAVGLSLIVGSAFGIIWAFTALIRRRGEAGSRRRWVRPLIILVPSLAILGFIIGASYNSYRQSLGPPGDHSVENASADTRALWEAANRGDVAAVRLLTAETCADPWVKFPQGNGRHNAKGQAESRTLEVPDVQEPPFNEISGILGDYMDDWYDRCGRDG